MTDCDNCKEYDKEKNYCPVFCNVINETLTDRVIEELEKIKEEIFWSELDNIEYITYWKALNHCCEIVDKHISELKGEKE